MQNCDFLMLNNCLRISSERCLWFLMEPLIKNEKYSYSFYRRMIENIKQTKDKQNPDDLDLNYVSETDKIKFHIKLYGDVLEIKCHSTLFFQRKCMQSVT